MYSNVYDRDGMVVVMFFICFFLLVVFRRLPIATDGYPLPARRPYNSRLSTAKLIKTFNLELTDWRQHVNHMVNEIITKEALL